MKTVTEEYGEQVQEVLWSKYGKARHALQRQTAEKAKRHILQAIRRHLMQRPQEFYR